MLKNLKFGPIIRLQAKTNKEVNMKAMDTTALVLLVIGGINWGLVGFFDYNLVDSAFGVGSFLARAIYAIVGIAAVWTAVSMSYRMMNKE